MQRRNTKGGGKRGALLRIRFGQAAVSCQERFALSRAVASRMSFRVMAAMATLAGFAALTSCRYLAFRSGLIALRRGWACKARLAEAGAASADERAAGPASGDWGPRPPAEFRVQASQLGARRRRCRRRRGLALDVVAREANVSVAKLTERALAGE